MMTKKNRMRSGMKIAAVAGLGFAPLGCAKDINLGSDEVLAEQNKVAVSKLVRKGGVYQSEKYLTANGQITSRHFDGEGNGIEKIPSRQRAFIDPRLQARLEAKPGETGFVEAGEPLDVVFVLADDPLPYVGPEAVIEVAIDQDGEQSVAINGEKSSLRALNALQEELLSAASELSKARAERRRAMLGKLGNIATRDQGALKRAYETGAASVRARVTREQLAELADQFAGVVISIEPWVEEYDELTSAMAATNVQTWAIDRNHDGTNAGIYMREANGSRCPSSSNMNSGRYTNISSLSSSSHANKVGNILATVSPDAHVYCGSSDFLSSPGSRSPRPWIANHSWGADDSGAYTTRDRDFDTGIYDDGWTVFKSAGNTGGEITSPGKAMNIIAVGNYIDSTTSMSSSSAFTDPDSNSEKPEIAAPGSVSTDAGSCSGTSCAAPHAAGFAANLLGRYSWLRGQPARVKALMMAGATDNIEGSARLSDKDGAGGIDYLNSGYNGTNTVWWGGNGSHFNAQGVVTTTRSFVAGRRYRVALSWLVPGSFAYSPSSYHSHDYTINMDLDLSIKAPNGSTVAGSYSWDNPFEIVDFTAPTTGTYTIRIRRFSNSGSGKINMAVHSQRVL